MADIVAQVNYETSIGSWQPKTLGLIPQNTCTQSAEVGTTNPTRTCSPISNVTGEFERESQDFDHVRDLELREMQERIASLEEKLSRRNEKELLRCVTVYDQHEKRLEWIEHRLRAVLQEQWKSEKLLHSLIPNNDKVRLQKACQTSNPIINISEDDYISDHECHYSDSIETLSIPELHLLKMKECPACLQPMPECLESHAYCLPSTTIID